jgi:hypothetical protein
LRTLIKVAVVVDPNSQSDAFIVEASLTAGPMATDIEDVRRIANRRMRRPREAGS